MKQPLDSRSLVQQQAITNARAAAILGFVVDRRWPGFPMRVKTVPGRIREDRVITSSIPMVLAPRTLKATSLIDIVASTQAAIAVSHANKVRPLRLDFYPYFEGSRDWIELRVSRSKVLVEAVPDEPIEVANIEDLAAALHEVREARGIGARVPVDVLVDPDVATQQLVEILVALDVAGVRSIGIGPMPGLEDLALRGHRIPSVSVFVRYLRDRDGTSRYAAKMNVEEIKRCYADALADDPDLSGKVIVQFYLEAEGEVTAATAHGVDPALADCVARVFETLRFSKSEHGINVQAEVALRFRP